MASNEKELAVLYLVYENILNELKRCISFLFSPTDTSVNLVITWMTKYHNILIAS